MQPITTDELSTLTEGQVLLRKRKNKRIKKCGGCSVPLNKELLIPPHDVCLARKERRPKQGRSWGSKREDDFVLTNVHYHVKRKCIGQIDASKIIVSRSLSSEGELEKYEEEFRKSGITLSWVYYYVFFNIFFLLKQTFLILKVHNGFCFATIFA